MLMKCLTVRAAAVKGREVAVEAAKPRRAMASGMLRRVSGLRDWNRLR